MFRKLLDQGEAGDNVGVLLRGTKRDDVERGQGAGQTRHHHPTPTSKPKSASWARKKAGGTRRSSGATGPQFSSAPPTSPARSTCRGVEMVMPGDNVRIVVSLIAPIAMDEGLRFAIREGGRTVGAGVVAKVIEVSFSQRSGWVLLPGIRALEIVTGR